MLNLCSDNEWKKIIGFFYVRVASLFKICSFVLKTEFDLVVLVKNLLPNFISIFYNPLRRKWTKIVGGPTDRRHTDSSKAIYGIFPSLKRGIKNRILSPATSSWQETCVSRVIIHNQRIHILAIMFQEQSLLSLCSIASSFHNNMVTIQVRK